MIITFIWTIYKYIPYFDKTNLISQLLVCVFIMANALNLFCNMVDRSQVFNLQAVEKDLSGVALVSPLTRSSFVTLVTFGISFTSSSHFLITARRSAALFDLF